MGQSALFMLQEFLDTFDDFNEIEDDHNLKVTTDVSNDAKDE